MKVVEIENMYTRILLFTGLIIASLMTSSCSVIFANRHQAYRDIGKLKETAILVRLRSAENKIKMLKDLDRADEALRIQEEVHTENEEIKAACNEHFDFCDFYFFDASAAEDIQNEDFDKVQLLDGQGKIVEDISFLENGFYVLSFEGIYETQFTGMDDLGNRFPIGGTSSSPGVAIQDKDFIQLLKPFPYKISYGQLPVRYFYRDDTDKDVVVEKINETLHAFYNRHYEKVQKFKDR